MEMKTNEIDLHYKKDISISNIDTVTLEGGCYCCILAAHNILDGVIKVETGVSANEIEEFSHKKIHTNNTKYTEVVKITFDKTKTSLEEILKVFYTEHDSAKINRNDTHAVIQYPFCYFLS